MKELSFNLKGERNYIQGPDIYDALNRLFKGARLFELSFHQIMTHNILLSENEPKDLKELYFIAKFKDFDKVFNADFKDFKNEISGEKILFGLKNSRSKPSVSVPYKEEEIINKTKLDLDKKEIILEKPSGFTFMEEIIALNKHLLLNLFREKKGKWYFARVLLKDNFKEFYPLKMSFETHFNFVLAKSSIYTGDMTGGNVFFGSPQMF